MSARDDLAEFLREATPIIAVTALVNAIVDLGWRPPVRVLVGDSAAVAAALAALPIGSIVEVGDEVFRAKGGLDTSGDLAARFVGLPITVVREGLGHE